MPSPDPAPRCATLIEARWVIPIDPEARVIERGWVAVDDGAIVAVGGPGDAPPAPAERVVLGEHALLPGLVNAHGHAAMTLLRGAADDLPLDTWLRERIWPLEAALVDADFVRDGTRLAIAEMLASGTTCFSDMYFFPETALACALEAGIRMQVAVPIVDFPNRWSANAADAIHRALALRDETRHEPLARVALGPHSPYVVGRESLERIATFASELDMPVHIHVSETAAEKAAIKAEHGVLPVRYLADTGLLAPGLQVVHAIHLEPAERTLLAEHGAAVVHCPASNLKLASGICPVPDYVELGVTVALGSDGAAANNTLDLFREASLAALLGKGGSGDASRLSAAEVLRMATLAGAEALGLGAEIGSIEVGKRADLVAVDLSGLRHQPVTDVVSQLVYTNCGPDVSDVWVDGRPRLRHGELLDVDAAALAVAADAWSQRVRGL